MTNKKIENREKYNKLLIDLLSEYTKVLPEMRIGQILSNCIPNIENIYYIESDDIIKCLITHIKSHPEIFYGKINLKKYTI